MKKPLPLSDLADMLDACESSPVIEAIRAAFAVPGADLVQISRQLAALPDSREQIAVVAFRAYALHESGGLVTTSARLYQRGVFNRCLRYLLDTKL